MEGTPHPLQYMARDLDATTGLYYVRNRWYDPQLGRFVSEDPIGLAGGVNLYAYAANNPVSLTDPYGLNPRCTSGRVPTHDPLFGSSGSWHFMHGGENWIKVVIGSLFTLCPNPFGGGPTAGAFNPGRPSGAGPSWRALTFDEDSRVRCIVATRMLPAPRDGLTRYLDRGLVRASSMHSAQGWVPFGEYGPPIYFQERSILIEKEVHLALTLAHEYAHVGQRTWPLLQRQLASGTYELFREFYEVEAEAYAYRVVFERTTAKLCTS